MSEQLYEIDVLFGVNELQSRLRPESANRIVGEGRSRVIDRNGIAGPWTEWTPTGVALVFDDAPKAAAPWWKFW